MEEHYAHLKKDFRTKALLEKEFLEKFPEERDFLQKLYAQQKLHPLSHLKPIVELAAIYPEESMRRAFTLAKEYNTFSSHFIRGLLEREKPQEERPERGATSLHPLPQVTVKADIRSW